MWQRKQSVKEVQQGNVTGFEQEKAPWAKKCRWPAETGIGKEMDSPLEPPEGSSPADSLTLAQSLWLDGKHTMPSDLTLNSCLLTFSGPLVTLSPNTTAIMQHFLSIYSPRQICHSSRALKFPNSFSPFTLPVCSLWLWCLLEGLTPAAESEQSRLSNSLTFTCTSSCTYPLLSPPVASHVLHSLPKPNPPLHLLKNITAAVLHHCQFFSLHWIIPISI